MTNIKSHKEVYFELVYYLSIPAHITLDNAPNDG